MGLPQRLVLVGEIFAKDWLLNGQEQACTRIAWLFGRLSSPCQNGLINKKMIVDFVLVIKAIGKTTFPDKTGPEIYPREMYTGEI